MLGSNSNQQSENDVETMMGDRCDSQDKRKMNPSLINSSPDPLGRLGGNPARMGVEQDKMSASVQKLVDGGDKPQIGQFGGKLIFRLQMAIRAE